VLFPFILDKGIVALFKNKSMYYIYILKCGDGLTYTGCTKDLKERFGRHKNGAVPATKLRLPIELIFYCAFKDKYKAFEFEKYLKSGSGRAFMQKRFI
jgi:predicted GIY-YIG superfamily endonuclease